MEELQTRRDRFERQKTGYFSACSPAGGSTFSIFVKLNQSYENICFVFDHRADASRIPGLSVTEERRSHRDHIHGRHNDPWNVNFGLGQEDLDYEENFGVGFGLDRSFGFSISVGKEDHEEESGS